MKAISRVRATLCTAALTLSAVFAATASLAAPASAAPEADHCLTDVADPSSEVCFGTAAQARKHFEEMGGQAGPPKGGDTGVTARAGAAIGIPTLLYIGFDWTNQNFLGGSYWLYGYNGGCTWTLADTDYGKSQLPSSWEDRITSTQLYSNCAADHFDGGSYTGASTGYQGSRNALSVALNNDADSILLS